MTTATAIAAQPNGKAWHSQSVEEVLAQLGSAATGLSAQDATQRLAANGPNELKEGKRISPLQIFLGQFKSLIIWILIAAGVISGVLGEVVDAIAVWVGFLVLFGLTRTTKSISRPGWRCACSRRKSTNSATTSGHGSWRLSFL